MKRTPWWLWTVGTFIIIAGWIVFAAVVSAIVSVLVPDGPVWAELLVSLSTFIPFFLATPLVWRYLLGRPVAELLNFSGRMLPRRIGVGFGIWFALCAASTGLDALLHADDYVYTFSASKFLPFALVVALLLPAQTWAEEFFFRGWVLNWASTLPLFSQVFISGIVFAWPHMGNPEAATDTTLALSAYFLLGAGWAYVSLRSGGIELAMGAHLANNAFSLLAVGYDDAALPTAAVFTTTSLNLLTTVVSLLAIVPLFAYFTRKQVAA
jgi:membrane protease YdiL (CAAX protease family)